MNKFETLKELINSAQTICLSTHIMPDGDAIGSIGALYEFLKEIGKDVYMIIPSMLNKFNFLPDIDKALKKVPIETYDLLIALDCSRLDRIAIQEEDIKKAKKIAVVDHHMKNNIKADIEIVDEKAPACSEILYDFFKYMNYDIKKKVAEYIYLGIMTDTGSFNYERTTGKTYRIAAEMVDLGINFTNTCKIMNDTFSENKMKLVAYIIDNMEVYYGGKLRIAVLDKDIQEKYNVKEDDLDSLVNYLRCIEGTIASIYIRRINDLYKVSMRTDSPIDASKIALEYNGGGHVRAAGFITCDLDKVKKELIEKIGRLLVTGENNGNS